MAIQRVPIGQFMAEVRAAHKRRDGYIMGATGQNPRKWSKNSWWYTQYSGKQKDKALYWRENAERVWDCNGLSEGIYQDITGVNINTKARYNYSGWCGIKGKGMIPADKRVEGAAVFNGKTAATITHVMYLDKPVDPNNPRGDWYLIEARGVSYGVQRNRLYERGCDFWGIMDKYFDYGDADYVPAEPELGEVILRNGMEDRADVKQMQTYLMALGYDLGKYGADGDFGDMTEQAVEQFQRDHGCDVDGKYGQETHAAMLKALEEINKPVENAKRVKIEGGQCWIRSAPNVNGEKLGIAKRDSVHEYAGETAANGWLKIDKGWVSGKYGKLVD